MKFEVGFRPVDGGLNSCNTQFVFLNACVTVRVADRGRFFSTFLVRTVVGCNEMCVFVSCARSGYARAGVAIVIAVLSAVVVVAFAA